MKSFVVFSLTLISLNLFAQSPIRVEASMDSYTAYSRLTNRITITGAAAKKLYSTLSARSQIHPWGFNGEHWTEKVSSGIRCSKTIEGPEKYECSLKVTDLGVEL